MSIKNKIKNVCIEYPVLHRLLNAAIQIKKNLKKAPKVDFSKLNCSVKIEDFSSNCKTSVVDYWSGHTVNSIPFTNKEDSLNYLQWRSDQYPFFHELMDLWGDHTGEVVVDYGCGPE